MENLHEELANLLAKHCPEDEQEKITYVQMVSFQLIALGISFVCNCAPDKEAAKEHIQKAIDAGIILSKKHRQKDE